MGLQDFFDYDGTATGEDELDFLRAFDEPQWNALLAYTTTERFEVGQVVMAQGSMERALYIVGDGELEVLVGSGAKRQRIARCDRGDVVGEQVFLDGKPRSAEVRALRDTHVVKLGIESFESFAAQYPDLARVFLFDLARIVSLRLRETTALLIARR